MNGLRSQDERRAHAGPRGDRASRGEGFALEAVEHVKRRMRHREEHVWYELRLADVPLIPPLEEPLRLVVALGDQSERVEQLEQQSIISARQRAEGRARPTAAARG